MAGCKRRSLLTPPPQVFALIHAVTTSPEVLARITREVIADFEADGVCYLELR